MASRNKVLKRTAGVSRRPGIGAYGSPARGMTARPGRPGSAGPGDMTPRPQRPPPPPPPDAGPGGMAAKPRWYESCPMIGNLYLLDVSMKSCFQPPAGSWTLISDGDTCPAGLVKTGQKAVKYRPSGPVTPGKGGGPINPEVTYWDVCVPGQK